jgi:hypothetical protein
MRRDNISDGSVALHFGPDDDAVKAQFEVMYDALLIYEQRNENYKDNWRRMGWRGVLVRIRERAERLWDVYWWDGEDVTDLEDRMYPPRNVDDAIDLINFAAFFVRGMNGHEATRDGSWWGR